MPKNLIPEQFRSTLSESTFSRRLSKLTWVLLVIFGITLSILSALTLRYLQTNYHFGRSIPKLLDVSRTLNSLDKSLGTYLEYRNDVNLDEAFRRHRAFEKAIVQHVKESDEHLKDRHPLVVSLQKISRDTNTILLKEETLLRSPDDLLSAPSVSNAERLSELRVFIKEILNETNSENKTFSRQNEKIWWWLSTLVILGLWSGLWIWGRGQLQQVKRAFHDTLDLVEIQVAQQKVFFESIGDAVLATNERGEVAYFNPEAEKITELRLVEGRGQLLEDILARGEDKSVSALLNIIHKVFETEQGLVLPKGTLLNTQSGLVKLIEGSVSPVLDPQQHFVGVIVVFRDCTEDYKRELSLMARERLYRRVFNQQFQYLIVLDALGSIKEMNEPFARLNGGRPEQFLQSKFWDLPYWKSFEGYENLWQQRIVDASNSDELICYEECHEQIDGTQTFMEINITVLEDEGHEPIGYLIQAQDITDKKLTEWSIQRTADKAKFLAHFSDAIRFVSDPMEVVRIATGHLSDFLQISHCAYAEVNELEKRAFVLYDYFIGERRPLSTSYHLFDFGEIALDELRRGEAWAFYRDGERQTSGKLRDDIESLKIESILATPLRKDGDLRALLLIFSDHPRRWTEDEIQLIEDVVERLHAYVERIRSEQETKHIDERYRLAIKATNDVIWDWDLKTDACAWNEAIADLSGYPLDNIPLHINWWLDLIHPEDRIRVEQSIRKAISECRDFWGEEYRIMRKDGIVAEVFDRGYLIKSDYGIPIRMIGSMQNLSERIAAKKQLEESALKLQLSLDAALLGTWEYSVKEELVKLDSRCQKLLELPTQSTIALNDFKSCFETSNSESIISKLESPHEGLQSKQSIQGVVVRESHSAEGGQRWLQINGNSFFDEAGKLTLMIGTLMDVSDQKRFELSLQQAKSELEAASKAKDNFLAALSHELRTPLTPVLMTISAIKEDIKSPSELAEQIEMIQRNIDLESRLIDDLLDLTKITEAKLVLRTQPCDLHQLIHHAVDIVNDELFSKKQRLTISLKAGVFGMDADPARLQQVFWNLLRNAVKFSPRETEISIVTYNDEKGRWYFEVADHGIGLTEEARTAIFEPFEQAGRQNDHRFGGLGLGLAIAKGITGMHGGRIEAFSEGENQGSVFKVSFDHVYPITPKNLSTLRGDLRWEHFPKQSLSTKSPLKLCGEVEETRILVVDDHEATLQVIQRLLKRRGFSVQTANCVDMALQVAGKYSFDLIISDIGLPDGTGIELMSELKKRYPSLLGIALSGYGMDKDQRRGIEAGFSSYLTKPINATQLMEAVDYLIEEKNQPQVISG